MQHPLFAALTPRAGKHNHRYLVPAGAPVTDESLSRFVRLAISLERDRAGTVQGANFLGVVREGVKQQQTEREGCEVLLLLGLDVGQLRREQCEKLLKQLSSRMNDLDVLVTKRIDWENEGEQLLVARPELKDWLLRLPLPLPPHSTIDKPLPSECRTGGRKRLVIFSWIFLIVFGLPGLCFGLYKVISSHMASPQPKESNEPEKAQSGKPSSPEDRLRIWAKEVHLALGLEEGPFLLQLIQAVKEDTGGCLDVDRAIIKERFANPDSLSTEEKRRHLAKLKRIDSFLKDSKPFTFFVFDPKNQERLQELVPTNSTSKGVARSRENLLRLLAGFKAYRNTIRNSVAQHQLKTNRKNHDSQFLTLLRLPSEKEYDLLDKLTIAKAPVAPFFTDYEAQAISLLHRYLSLLLDEFDKKLDKKRYSVKQPTKHLFEAVKTEWQKTGLSNDLLNWILQSQDELSKLVEDQEKLLKEEVEALKTFLNQFKKLSSETWQFDRTRLTDG